MVILLGIVPVDWLCWLCISLEARKSLLVTIAIGQGAEFLLGGRLRRGEGRGWKCLGKRRLGMFLVLEFAPMAGKLRWDPAGWFFPGPRNL
jgi:hypothetical protein